MLLTAEEAGYILQKSRRQIYGFLSYGHLFGYKVTAGGSEHTSWRIPEQSIIDYADKSNDYEKKDIQERIRTLRDFLTENNVTWHEG